MTTPDSSSKPRAKRRSPPPTKKNYLGILVETDAGWMLRGGVPGGIVVKVKWDDPRALVERKLVWELIVTPAGTTTRPFLLQPRELMDAQPDGRFPAGVSCSEVQVQTRATKPERGAGFVKKKAVSELLPLEELVTKGIISSVPAWAKGPGWKRRPAISVICPFCPDTLQVFRRYSPRGITAVCSSCRSIWRAADFSNSTQDLLAEKKVPEPGARRLRAKLVPTTFKCNECLETKPLNAFPLTNQRRCLNCGGQERSTSVRTVPGGLVGRQR